MGTSVSVLAQLKPEELAATAKALDVDPKKYGTSSELVSAVELAAIKKQSTLEAQARLEIKAETAKRLGIDPSKKFRPSPQDVAIANSPLKVVTYRNLESPASGGEPGADLPFTKGSYTFHLFDGHKYHLPLCLVTEEPLEQVELIATLEKFWISAGLIPKKAKAQARGDVLEISLPLRCTIPLFAEKKLPTGEHVSEIIGTEPRFLFSIHKDSPKDAVIGEVADEPAIETLVA